MTAAQILLLPGWQNAGAGHWQTRWQQLHGFERVQQDDWWWPRRGDWMTRLEDTLLADTRPAVLVAHGLGCHLVAAWAGHSQHTARVAAALLVAPTDLARADLPPQLQGWASRWRDEQARGPTALPFASTAVLSNDAPHSDTVSHRRLASSWGSETVTLDAAGPVDANSGPGDWPDGLAQLQALLQRAGLGRMALPA